MQRREQHLNPTKQESNDFFLGDLKMLLLLGIVLLVLWVLGFVAFHVAGGLIHLLLVFAVISIIWHLITGRRATV